MRASTELATVELLPELPLRLVSQVTPLWHATEAVLARQGLEPPFWAFAWAGGQAVARYLLDHPQVVRGRVLDFASGSGLVGLAAARAGAAEVVALDRDPLAAAAASENAEHLGLRLSTRCADVLAGDCPAITVGVEVVTAGDVCFDGAWAPRAMAWLRQQAGAGALVLLGDPGRSYLPDHGLVERARYPVESSGDVDPGGPMVGRVLQVLP